TAVALQADFTLCAVLATVLGGTDTTDFDTGSTQDLISDLAVQPILLTENVSTIKTGFGVFCAEPTITGGTPEGTMPTQATSTGAAAVFCDDRGLHAAGRTGPETAGTIRSFVHRIQRVEVGTQGYTTACAGDDAMGAKSLASNGTGL